MLGRHVARLLAERGHEVRVLSRRAPEHRVDLRTGAGLDAALDGCEVVVDAANEPPVGRGPSVLVDGGRNLVAAGAAAGVRHHVVVSIVGCDALPLRYYRRKIAQEQAALDGPVPCTIVRATQCHELLDAVLGATARLGVLPLPSLPLAPIAALEAGAAVADVAEGPPRGRVEVAGPEVRDARDLARAWAAARGRRLAVSPMPLPGRLGRELRTGALLSPRADVRGRMGFEAWMQTR